MPAADKATKTVGTAKRPFILHEIHLTVYGGMNDQGVDYGDHVEIYRPKEYGEEDCTVCGRKIVHGWSNELEKIRQQNGARPLSCAQVLVDPSTGTRKVTGHLSLPANLAKEFFDKGTSVIDVSAQATSFMAACQGGVNQNLAGENASLKAEIAKLRGEAS